MITYLTEDAKRDLQDLAAAARASGREEHAYLLGKRVRGKLVIRHAIRTPNTMSGVAIVQPDTDASRALLQPYLADNQLLGSAHIHFGLVGPSHGDEATLRSIEPEFPGYLCLVVTIGDTTSMTCHTIEDDALVAHKLQPYAYDTTIPQEQRVLILGAGSGAGNVALQLATWGVPFTILDHDRLEARNLRRHLLDRKALGKPKAVALRKLLQARTNAPITALVEQLTPDRYDRLAALIARHDLVLECTGDLRVAHLASQAAREQHKAVVHAGVFARGSGGYVLLNREGGACIGCLHGLPRIEPQSNDSLATLAQQYGFSEDEINAQAGLFTDITFVSSLQAKVGLEALRSDTSDLANLYLINNTEISITRHHVRPNRECVTCQGDEP